MSISVSNDLSHLQALVISRIQNANFLIKTSAHTRVVFRALDHNWPVFLVVRFLRGCQIFNTLLSDFRFFQTCQYGILKNLTAS